MTRTNDAFTRQETGQLHRLAAQLHHHLTWRDTTDNPDEDTWQYDIINTDWSHLNNTSTDNRDYTPDLTAYKNIGIIPADFLADRNDIENAVLELTAAIAGELEPDTPSTDTPRIETPGTPDDTPDDTSDDATDTQTHLTAYA